MLFFYEIISLDLPLLSTTTFVSCTSCNSAHVVPILLCLVIITIMHNAVFLLKGGFSASV